MCFTTAVVTKLRPSVNRQWAATQSCMVWRGPGIWIWVPNTVAFHIQLTFVCPPTASHRLQVEVLGVKRIVVPKVNWMKMYRFFVDRLHNFSLLTILLVFKNNFMPLLSDRHWKDTCFFRKKDTESHFPSRKKASALWEDLEADFSGRVDGKVVLWHLYQWSTRQDLWSARKGACGHASEGSSRLGSQT